MKASYAKIMKMQSRFNRLRMGLDLIQMDLNNCYNRNRFGIKNHQTQSLIIQSLIIEAKSRLKALKKIIATIERKEAKEKFIKKKRKNQGGQNMNLTGTYG